MNFYIFLLFILIKIHKNNGHASFDSKIAEAEVDKHDWDILWQEQEDHCLDLLSFHQTAPGKWLVIFRAKAKAFKMLRKFDIRYRIIVNDMRRYVETIKQEVKQGPPALEKGNVTFQNYLTIDEVLEYMESTPSLSTPNQSISTETIGTSVQDRTILMLKVENKGVKDIMLVEGGMHGREWISIMTAVYLITKLVNGDTYPYLEKMNWLVIPCLNPDGYYYSRHKKGYTFHRKNLNVKGCPPKGSNCTKESCGVDLNRNFAFHGVKAGIQSNPCAENYGGKKNFSEPESKALQRVLTKYKKKIKMYISLHSWGHSIVYPWSYKKEKAKDWRDLVKVAQEAVKAIKASATNVTNYNIKSGGKELSLIAGCSEDYAKQLGIKYSYRMELQPGGKRGFMPKLIYIKNLCKANFQGIAAMATYIKKQSQKLRSRTIKSINEVKSSQFLLKPNILYIMFLFCFLLN